MNTWRYEIVYDRMQEIYYIAEVYNDCMGRPGNWCRASLEGDTLEELGVELESMFKVYINQKKILRVNDQGKLVSLGSSHQVEG
jgi:hypothetical protein